MYIPHLQLDSKVNIADRVFGLTIKIKHIYFVLLNHIFTAGIFFIFNSLNRN